ncbi:MAG: DNA methyltransferase [Candidatus Hodarchaeota archaeon]
MIPGNDPERAPPININRCHQWYSFIQAFSAQLVRHVLSKFSHSSGLILDPFVGTGTTCVECKILGIPSVGIDVNPMALFASRVKTT